MTDGTSPGPTRAELEAAAAGPVPATRWPPGAFAPRRPPDLSRLDLEPYGTLRTPPPDTECPLCGAQLAPEHAHLRCRRCGYRDSCCD